MFSLYIEGGDLDRFAQMLVAAGEKAPVVIQRAVTRTGTMAKTRVVRALAAQVGLTQKRVRVEVVGHAGDQSYTIYSVGNEIPLKEFGARETMAGVSAAPFNQRRIFPGSFMKGGRFPNRVPAAKLNGHVFERAGSRRLPIVKVPSGVVIPEQMVQGESLDAFETTVETVLPRRIEHELGRLFG
jgi:hypothetical protein